ncbi:CPBP family intramembrane glutamic endopeptidase [Marinilactibacillus sp. Marseille-P9653]|uniref:CPBP family intramembrane glutamic endopeptidase n=1 Tax=Marinilactibacillus sp. Marseille-P9653 TaxID=2866583 RepID=UPI001CE41E0E|nr:CPBP family intramembrane glutamic endopeptidase [Marinilactibacillus sp. Marseille-P9653]
MNEKIEKVSLIKIILHSVMAVLIVFVCYRVLIEFVPESYSNLAPSLIQLTVNLAFIWIIKNQLNKNNIRLFEITGKIQVKPKEMALYIGGVIIKLLLSFTFLFSLIRIAIVFIGSEPIMSELLLDTSDSSSGLGIGTLIATAFLAPIVEELIFRGILLNKWTMKMSNKKALFWSALLFGILHFDSFVIPQLLGGLLYGMAYLKTKKLIYPIVLHVINNVALVLLLALPESEFTVENMAEAARELIFALNISSAGFLISLLLFGWFVYKIGKDINNEQAPYLVHSK